jgi:signal peptidase
MKDRKEKVSENKQNRDEKQVPIKKIAISVVLILSAFFGSFLIYFTMQVSLNTQSPMVVVVSGSMEPTILKGDLLIVQGKDPENIESGTIQNKEGDVIVYDARGLWASAPNEPIVHRVVDKRLENGTWYFLTKGDANLNTDPAWVPGNKIIGVVVARIPFIGWIKIFLTESNLLVPIIVILSFLIVISIFYDIFYAEEEEEKESTKEDESTFIKEYDYTDQSSSEDMKKDT